MDTRTSRNMYSFIPKKNKFQKLVHLVGFVAKRVTKTLRHNNFFSFLTALEAKRNYIFVSVDYEGRSNRYERNKISRRDTFLFPADRFTPSPFNWAAVE